MERIEPEPGDAQGRRRRAVLVRLLLGVALSALFGWLFVRSVDVGEAWHELRRLDLAVMAASVGIVLVTLALMAVRWAILLAASGPAPPASLLLVPTCVGRAANNVLPARGGDLVRVESARRRSHLSPGVLLGTIAAERILDGLVLALWIVVSALLLDTSRAFLALGLVLLAATGVAFALAALAAGRPDAAAAVVERLLGRAPERWRATLGRGAASFLAGLRGLRSRRALVQALAVTVAMWLVEVGLYALVAHGLGLDLPAGAFFLLHGVGNVALAVPAAAAGIGTFDYAILETATELGAPATTAAAYAVTLHAVDVLPVTILGAVLLARAFPARRG